MGEGSTISSLLSAISSASFFSRINATNVTNSSSSGSATPTDTSWLTTAGALGLFAAVLLIYVQLSIGLRATRRLRWLHESVAALLIGALVSLSVRLITRVRLPDSPAPYAFFAAAFVPIFFNSGITLRTSPLTRRSRAVLLFAVGGTVLSAASFGGAAYGIALLAGVPNADIFECLLFGALISSTDSISTVSLLVEMDVEPILYTVVMGESVLNDIVAIALSTAFAGHIGAALTWGLFFWTCFEFLWKTAVSFALGTAFGFVWVLLKGAQRSVVLSPTYDIATLLPFPIMAYAAADAAGVSGLLALFCTSAIVSHYSWYAVPSRTRTSLFSVSATADYVAQTTAFFALGVEIFLRKDAWAYADWNPAFLLPSIVLVFAARAANVFPLSLLLNITGKKFSLRHQAALWLCGLRGVVTPLLALNLYTPNRQLILNAAFVILLFTNVALSGAVRPLLTRLHVQSDIDRNAISSRRDVPTDEENEEDPRARWRRGQTTPSDGMILRNIIEFDNSVIEWVKHRDTVRPRQPDVPQDSSQRSASRSRGRRHRPPKEKGVQPELDLARAPSKPHQKSNALTRSSGKVGGVQGGDSESQQDTESPARVGASIDLDRLVMLNVIVQQPEPGSPQVTPVTPRAKKAVEAQSLLQPDGQASSADADIPLSSLVPPLLAPKRHAVSPFVDEGRDEPEGPDSAWEETPSATPRTHVVSVAMPPPIDPIDGSSSSPSDAEI